MEKEFSELKFQARIKSFFINRYNKYLLFIKYLLFTQQIQFVTLFHKKIHNLFDWSIEAKSIAYQLHQSVQTLKKYKINRI